MTVRPTSQEFCISLDVLAQQLCDAGITLAGKRVRIDQYADSCGQSEGLLSLIASGKKRGGASLLLAYEVGGETIPKTGDLAIVLDDDNQPRFVTRLVSVEIVHFAK